MRGRFSNDLHAIAVGDRVRLSGAYLRSTGQAASREGTKTWTVKGITGDFAIVDEAADTRWFTDSELATDPSLRWRRIALGNLVRVGAVSARNSP